VGQALSPATIPGCRKIFIVSENALDQPFRDSETALNLA
jgi:hypothetical protein